MSNWRNTQVTSPRFDAVLMLGSGVAVAALGTAMVPQHGIGWTFIFIGLVNVLNEMKVMWILRQQENETHTRCLRQPLCVSSASA